ncbi:hypothetical protein SynA1840_00876 [Synechococcus sp. A18-40]|nr:hypothetical protein SynA1840_00876 [Synechococcus sp. A18-40]
MLFFIEKHLALNLGCFYRNQAYKISNRQSCELMRMLMSLM